ncbi:1-deoxy-D-xylulose-5-phosphate synthase N-terminal domain-containing protein [Myceligenerans indicum]|uniref:Transketolase n=1 Tax=Myceligenerans indicum TaxID=2593663 RepID=A0ABS1LNN3_9MICO|nr:1-deoxy-D-xylulose-5-phosphate synthase N-terminal domain-containing protein [Myceligenerans indicum]MBL0887147.1 transketolase [Myceligenerans indicum]
MTSRTVTRRPVTRARITALMSRLAGDESHTAAATSTLDVLHVLYGRILRVTPTSIDDPDRDRFYLSKGHGPMAYYAVLAAHGFFPEEHLDTFGAFESVLGLHPDHLLVPGVEISSGSLGHGLPLAVGAAHALRIRDSSARVIVLVGDAELDEGSCAEAIEYAAAAKLENLTLVVVDNISSSYTVHGRIEQRLRANGWRADRVDGRDQRLLEEALARRVPGTPNAVVAQVEKKSAQVENKSEAA